MNVEVAAVVSASCTRIMAPMTFSTCRNDLTLFLIYLWPLQMWDRAGSSTGEPVDLVPGALGRNSGYPDRGYCWFSFAPPNAIFVCQKESF
jgi:hypothetical protein